MRENRARPVKRSIQWVAYFPASMDDDACRSKIAVAERVFRSRGAPLSRFLYALGIQHVGEHLADAYAKTGRTSEAIRTYRDCGARTEDESQRRRVAEKIVQLESRARTEPAGI